MLGTGLLAVQVQCAQRAGAQCVVLGVQKHPPICYIPADVLKPGFIRQMSAHH